MSMASLQQINDTTLEDIITCSICTLRLQEPKHLQCQHAFCAKCLNNWMQSPANSSTLGLPCPTCRHITRLPRDGVRGLPADFNKNVLLEMVSFTESTNPTMDEFCSTCKLSGKVENSVSFCTDCEEYLCGTCLGDHNSEPALKCHNMVFSGQQDTQVENYICGVHKRKKLSFYCPTCLHLICNVCIRTEHRGHGAQHIDIAVEEKKNSLKDTILMIDEKLDECGGQKNVEDDKNKIQKMFEDIRFEIRTHADSAKGAVDKWLVTALGNLETRQNSLVAKVASRENFTCTLSSLRLFYESKMEEVDPRTLLVEFDEILSKARPLLEHSAESFSVPSWTFVPLGWPDRLGFLEENGNRVSPFSTISKRRLPHRSRPKLKAIGRSWSEPSVNQAKLETNGFHEEMKVEVNGHDIHDNDTLSEDLNSIYGAMIVEEKVTLKSVKTWDNGCITDHPDDIIMADENWLLVCLREAKKVMRFWIDDSDKLPETILEGFQPGRMAISRDGSIAVTDPKHGMVHMLASKGTTITKRPKWTPSQMVQPWAVAFSNDTQNVILSDMHEKSIVVYDENLHHKITFGGDCFESPAYMCCDKYGRILVSDGKKNTVQAFNMSGEMLWKINDWGQNSTLIHHLRGITTDFDGRIVMVSGDGILLYGADAKFICHMLDRHDEPNCGKGVSWIQTSSDNVLLAVSQWKQDSGGKINIYNF